MEDINQVQLKKLYERLIVNRDNFLNRAKEASEITVPQLFPRIENTSSTTFPTPYQSLGARGVNNLANKIILSLFPPATAFFKLDANQAVKQGNGVTDGDMTKAMQVIEKSLVDEMEVSQLRSKLVEVIKQCIVGGSSVLYIPNEDHPKVYSLFNFGIRRSKSGKMLQLVVREQLAFSELPVDVQSSIPEVSEDEKTGKKLLEIFTAVIRNEKGDYDTIQEVKGVKIKGSEGVYKEKEVPFIFVPFVDRGEDYARSYVEDFIGDIQSYEGLSKAILEGSAESARIIYLIKQNATLTPKKLQTANSGDVLKGDIDDVGTLQANKSLDLSVTQKAAEELKRDLSTLFLLDSSVRRDAERVTAEEIRRVSQELETAFGGIYATLANHLQEPLVRLYLKRLTKKGTIQDVVKNNVDLQITTGSAALGRGTEFEALSRFVNMARELLGERVYDYLNISETLQRGGYALDVNTAGLVRTEEELQAQQQLEQQQQLQQQAIGPAINAASQQQLAKEQG